MAVHLRPFEEHDYPRLAEVSAAIDPRSPLSPEMLRHRDAPVDSRVRLLRVAAEWEGAGVVGFGRIMHIWWNFHPRRFVLGILVEPAWQRRGVGAALFDRLTGELGAWNAELVRADARGTETDAHGFLQRRGFTEWRRRWQSVLDVASADVTLLEAAAGRSQAAGVTITTYPAELERRGQKLSRDLYEMEFLISRDEPAIEDDGAGMSFEHFCSVELDTPNALPEGHFLALSGERLVGVSRLTRNLQHPDIADQAFTGVHPEFRGRGIAQALKLRTIEFARARSYREIRTNNDSTNAPMLHINDAIGFRRETPVVIYERCFAEPGLDSG